MTSKAPLAQPTYNSLSWDVPLNSNFDIITDALGVVTSVSVTTVNVTLTATQAQRFGLAVSGALTGNRTLFLPQNCAGSWIVYNGTSGGYDLSIYNNDGSGTPAGTGVTPPTGYSYVIYSDGTNVSYADSNIVRKTGDTMLGALALPSNGLNVGSGQLQVTGGNVTASGTFSATGNITSSAIVTGNSVKTDTITEQTPSAGVTVSGVPIANSAISGDYLRIASKTAQATTSGTSFSYTGIPTWAKRITIMFAGVSLSGSDSIVVRIGPSGGVASSGYVSSSLAFATSNAISGGSSTSSFIIYSTSGYLFSGLMTICLLDASSYIYAQAHNGKVGTATAISGGGNVTLTGLMTQLTITRSGTNTFDAGSVNILYE